MTISQKLLVEILKFNFFLKQIEIFLNMGPYGSEHFKMLLYSCDSFLTKHFMNVPCDSPHTSYILGF